jgi:(E)-4-hydroxy-3-methylbut-2-enyl-diphosphate synthase
MEIRKKSHAVQIGNLKMGDHHRILTQTMTNTFTTNIEATINQCCRIAETDCDIVRITVPQLSDVPALEEIKRQLRSRGVTMPLVADVHFHPEVAEATARIVEKVRINPGNFTDKKSLKTQNYSESEFQEGKEMMGERARKLLEICREEGTCIRIGVNHGSLCDRIISRYGNTPLALAESAMEWIEICEHYNFRNIVFSLKSSNVTTMIEANLILAQLMETQGKQYPLHLGVTEAANGMEGRIKSAAGIGALLYNGYGDTLRVSLTEAPEKEVVFAKKLLQCIDAEKLKQFPIVEGKLVIESNEKDAESWWASCAALAGFYHQQKLLKEIVIHNPNFSTQAQHELEEQILQACRIKMTRTEIVACPSCGRTQYDIQSVLHTVKERFSHYPNLKIGVMGCVVNGPGEMADADFGVIGNANGKIAVFKGHERVSEFLPIEEALKELEVRIEQSVK